MDGARTLYLVQFWSISVVIIYSVHEPNLWSFGFGPCACKRIPPLFIVIILILILLPIPRLYYDILVTWWPFMARVISKKRILSDFILLSELIIPLHYQNLAQTKELFSITSLTYISEHLIKQLTLGIQIPLFIGFNDSMIFLSIWAWTAPKRLKVITLKIQKETHCQSSLDQSLRHRR